MTPQLPLPSKNLKRLLYFCLATFCNTVISQPAMLQQASDIDWVSFEALSPQQRALLQDNCCGMYVEPTLPPENGTKLSADELDAQNGGLYTLEGDIEIHQKSLLLKADTGLFDNESGNAMLEGNVQIRQPGLLLIGSDAEVENAGEISRLNNASYLLHEGSVRGAAEVIVYTDADGIITIDNGRYTRCEPGDNSWIMEGQTITLNQQSGRGLARNVTLRLGNVPVFYLPAISFPINDDRATGFLASTIGSTRNGGLDISTPYYLNLAPNYDATLYPRLMTDRGVLFGFEGRHRSRRSLDVLQMNYLPDDDLFNPAELLLPDPDSPPVADRWQLSYDHQSIISRNWSAQADYSAVSDKDYFQDLGDTGLHTTTRSYLSRLGGVRYQDDNWRVRVQALDYQIIDPTILESREPYQRLPKVDLRGTFSNPLGFKYGLNAEYVNFDRDLDPNELSASQLASGALVTGQRLTVEPEITFPWSSPGAFFSSTFKYRYASYDLDDPSNVFTDDPTRGVFSGSLNGGLIFDRELDLDSGQMTQTLEPRLFYLYNEFEDQSDIPIFDSSNMTFGFNQLFRENRFSGKDRIGDTNQLTLALTTRFLNESGREKASASIGQIHYFEDRRVTLSNRIGNAQRTKSSAVASEFSFQFSDNWRINSYVEWDSEDNNLDVGNFQFRYQSDINHILNFSYRFRDSTNPITSAGFDRRIKQTDLSAIWPVSENWGLIARRNYDHANSRTLESIAGFEYNNCCYTVRVIGRKWIDNDALFFGNEDNNTGIFLQFELKGLGSVLGGNVTGILNNGISGYRDREY